MLKINEDIYCGLFDSNILRKGQKKSADRKVLRYEIELYHNDCGVSYADGKAYPIRKGLLFFAKPGQVRHSDFPVRCNFIHIFPSENVDRDILSVLDSMPTCVYIESDDEIDTLIAAFNKLASSFVSSNDTEIDTVRVNALFADILYRCMHVCEKRADKSSSQAVNLIVRQTYEYIREHYREDCSLHTLAKAVNVSPNHLQSVFAKNAGITPYKYLTMMRIEKAKKLLMAGERSLLEIALEIGFCSQSHFTKVFKEQTGKTPSAYQKELLEKY